MYYEVLYIAVTDTEYPVIKFAASAAQVLLKIAKQITRDCSIGGG